jgi:predicted AAA+ superfamily ATPase
MYRNAMVELREWKNRVDRQPLILQGARQVGKTWLMKEFARIEYKDFVYINFDEQKEYRNVFGDNLIPQRIIEELEIRFECEIIPQDTLIIFDEIQECNRALISLKYFCEEAPQYNIIAAGSLLGVAMHTGNSYPVGKVDILTLYPMTFAEFLEAAQERRYNKIIDSRDYTLFNAIKDDIVRYFKHYLFVGGMPKAVLAYIRDKDFKEVRRQQEIILDSYRGDFSKHISSTAFPKVAIIWDAVPTQLTREHKRFIYKDMQQGARASNFEDAMSWLVRTGLIYKINNVSKPEFPLATYQVFGFKLFILDVGLFGACVGLTIQNLVDDKFAVFNNFKGALAEQYVLQELEALGKDLKIFYWSKASGAEIDFLVQYNGHIIPIEVKSDENRQAKSLKIYIKDYKPKYAIRASLAGYGKQDFFYSIPLYLIGQLKDIIDAHKGGD